MLPLSRKYDYLESAPHPQKPPYLCRAPACLHRHLQVITVCVAAAPAEKSNSQVISTGSCSCIPWDGKQAFRHQARRKMPSLGLISLLCLIKLNLSQIYLHLITVRILWESHGPHRLNEMSPIFLGFSDEVGTKRTRAFSKGTVFMSSALTWWFVSKCSGGDEVCPACFKIQGKKQSDELEGVGENVFSQA